MSGGRRHKRNSPGRKAWRRDRAVIRQKRLDAAITQLDTDLASSEYEYTETKLALGGGRAVTRPLAHTIHRRPLEGRRNPI